MGSYRPPQRQIEAWILAGSRWLRGTFHVPRLHAFCEHLQKPRPFLVITDVSHGGDRTLPFLALRRSLVELIVPLAPEPLLQLHVSAGAESRPVECWLQDAVVVGELALMPGVRISDFMLHHDGFFTLRHAVVTPAPPGTEELVPCVIVNGREVVAVTEERTPLAPDPLAELEPIGAEETA
ncbi:MAG: hypothetical protein WCC48_05360 [Anaeromyxobacteraceae bacterium]